MQFERNKSKNRNRVSAEVEPSTTSLYSIRADAQMENNQAFEISALVIKWSIESGHNNFERALEMKHSFLDFFPFSSSLELNNRIAITGTIIFVKGLLSTFENATHLVENFITDLCMCRIKSRSKLNKDSVQFSQQKPRGRPDDLCKIIPDHSTHRLRERETLTDL